MPRGIDVGLCPGDIVLDGNPAPPTQKGTAAPFPLFGPYLLWPNGHLSQLLLSSYCREYYHRGVESYFVSHGTQIAQGKGDLSTEVGYISPYWSWT